MGRLIDFTKNESGAVTVDWVVLTAAVVGIAISIVALISSGLQNAANGIDGELQTLTNYSLASEGTGAPGTLSGYIVIFGNDRVAVRDAIASDAPAGFTYVGAIDVATDTAIYEDTSGETNNLSINGEIIDSATYLAGNPEFTNF